MSIKNISISSVVIAGIALSAWSLYSTKHVKNSTPGFAQATTPDAFMEGVTATIMNKDGTPSMKVMTPKMIHYAQDDTTELTSPKVMLYRREPQPWSVQAKFAKATQGIEKIVFWDNVIINNPGDQINPNTTIATTSLSVFPELQTAWTEELITMTQPNLRVQGKGMEASIKEGTIKLLSQAKGFYVPGS